MKSTHVRTAAVEEEGLGAAAARPAAAPLW